uniref:protein FAM63A-like n=1 Tax=Fragaria vesca subsp. vesca TaxID=101020 RepID=UPI0005C82354|nr:PREDICTED: protein FAM63A-like [Fragaria vesca subsp. vesca]
MESKSKSEPERYIICGQTKFEGKWVPIFYESVFDCGLVAIANILSLHGELPGGPHKIGFYSVEQLMTFVATKLSAVKRITTDDAKGILTPLAGHIEADVNYRRIEVVNFPGHNIFRDLRIPLYHGWKVVPKVHVPQDLSVNDLRLIAGAAQNSSITPQELDFIRNTYPETECTAYGYTALAAVLHCVRSRICVLYWHSRFYTLHKKDDGLVILDHFGEWIKICERRILIDGPSLGRRRFKIRCGGMIRAVNSMLCENIRDQANLLPHIDIQVYYHESLDSVVQCIESGDHFDLVAINYEKFDGSQAVKKKICEWLWRLRSSGFYGLVIAIIWSWSDGDEYQQWVNNEIYTQVGISGIRYVRAECLQESEVFIRTLVPIFEEAIWRREVVYAEEYPADIQSLEFIRRG